MKKKENLNLLSKKREKKNQNKTTKPQTLPPQKNTKTKQKNPTAGCISLKDALNVVMPEYNLVALLQ